MSAPHGKSAFDAIEEWLRSHPDAHVAALGPDAMATELPPEVVLGPDHVLETRSLLDLVIPEDRSAVATGFVTARRTGQGVAKARLLADGRDIVIHYVDLSPDRPVCIRMHVDDDQARSAPTAASRESGRARVGIITKDEAARVIGLDGGAIELLGWKPEQLVGSSTLDLIHPDDQDRALENWWAMHLGSGRQVVRLRYRRGDGSWLWLETSNSYDRDERGPGTVTCQIIDVSQEMAAADALRRNEELLRQLTESVPVGLCFLNRQRGVTYLNPRLAQLLGTQDVHDLDALGALLTGDGRSSLAAAASDALDEGHDGELDVTLARPGRSTVRCRVTLSAVVDQDTVTGALVCVVDVTELKTQATVDPLTGLLNRRAILRTLTDELADTDTRTGVLFLDLDAFKAVNDLHGHRTGDQLLVAVAERIRTSVRDLDLVGRVGGDEFMVLCPDVTRREDVEQVARRVVTAFEEGFAVADGTASVGVSVGMTLAVGSVETAQDVVARADAAMYLAKRRAAGPMWAEATPVRPKGGLRRRHGKRATGLGQPVASGTLDVVAPRPDQAP